MGAAFHKHGTVRTIWAGGAAIERQVDDFCKGAALFVDLLPGFVGTVEVGLETTPKDPAVPCGPYAAGWSRVQSGGPCMEAEDGVLTLASTDDAFVNSCDDVARQSMACAAALLCPMSWARAVVTSPDGGDLNLVVVSIVGYTKSSGAVDL